jgi:hypothetical protein
MATSELNSAERLAMKLEDAGLSYDEAIEWVAEVIHAEVLRLVCRCGKMILEPSDGCTWHQSNAEKARLMRKMPAGTVEY